MKIERLRRGELIAGGAAVVLLVLLFVPEWYSLKSTFTPTATVLGAHTSWNGWWGLSGARYLTLVTILVAFALAYFQAATPAPGLPATLSVIATVLGAANLIAVLYRVLAGPPTAGALLDQQVGAWLGLLASIGIACGAFASLREEGGPDPDLLHIETLRLTDRP